MGAEEAGVTVFRPDAGVDTGPVVVQKGGVEIAPTDTSASLYFDKLYALGLEAIAEAVAAIDAGTAAFQVQDESQASHQGLVDDEVARLDWTRDVAELDRWIRGCDPQPGAWSLRGSDTIRCFDTHRVSGDPGSAPAGKCSASRTVPRSWRRKAGCCASAGFGSVMARSRRPPRPASRRPPHLTARSDAQRSFEAALDDAGLGLHAALPSRATTRRFPKPGKAPACSPERAPRFWWAAAAAPSGDAFSRAPEFGSEPEPLDAFTRRVVEAATAALERAGHPSRALLAFERHGGVHADFVALAERAGLGARSRLGLLVHPLYGPWLSLRALVLTEARWSPEPLRLQRVSTPAGSARHPVPAPVRGSR